MNDILRLLLISILLTISLAAYFLIIGALFTTRVEKTQRVIHQMPGRAFGVGLVNFLFFGVILLVLFTITDGSANRVNSVVRIILLIPTFALTAILTAILSLGIAGMLQVLGERIFPDLSGLRRSVSSTVISAFACALPVVGWFLLLPYIALTGFGAVILGFFQREK
jgi:hypothetical protein